MISLKLSRKSSIKRHKWLAFLLLFSSVFILWHKAQLKNTVLRQSPVSYGCGYGTLGQSGEFNATAKMAFFNGQKMTAPTNPEVNLAALVLGETSLPEDQKRIEVSLAEQKLRAYEGNRLIMEFPVSTGKWGRTPTGTFYISHKFRYSTMSGGSPELNTDYYLPNVPYVMFFQNGEVPTSRGFSIHGTYWHNNFGTPMSHGCVNLSIPNAAAVFNWTSPIVGTDKSSQVANSDNPGTKIIIY